MAVPIPFFGQFGMIDLAALRPSDLSAYRLGDALSKINRYSGSTPWPWSVAAHSALVEWLCEPIDLKGWALLHDAHEAFIGDITSPALEFICASGTRTSVIHAVNNAKGRLDRAIGAAWECPPRSMNVEIRRADWIALQAEMAVFCGIKPDVIAARDLEDIARAKEQILSLPQGQDWQQARDLWISRAEELASMGLLQPPKPQLAQETA